MPEVPAAKPPLRDRPLRWRRCLLLASLALLIWLLQLAAASAPELTESCYSRTLYPHIAAALVAISSSFPFSLAETLLLLGLTVALLRCLRAAIACLRRRRTLRNVLGRAAAQTLTALAITAIAFELLWGFNHSRLPFADHLGLQRRPVHDADLVRTVHRLAERATACRPATAGTAQFLPPDWRPAIAAAYRSAGAEWPVLAGPPPLLRSPWLSPLMTLASITGIYSPFTGEAHVNNELPLLSQPFVACHEIAHLRGFAREDEANFIAWWVGSRAADPAIAYSCELAAFRYAFWQLQIVDPIAAGSIAALAPDVIADARSIDRFWQQQPPMHEVVTMVANLSNDLYLRSSGHAEGTRSYGRMVDLLTAVLAD